MVRKNKQKIRDLQYELYGLKWENADIHASEMDPDVKAFYLNDLEYKQHCIQKEIERLEGEEAMLPLKLMLAGFIVSVVLMCIYFYSQV